MKTLLSLALCALVSALTFAACGDEDDEVGTPCESKEDCSPELICDIHEGKGTCQYDHGH